MVLHGLRRSLRTSNQGIYVSRFVAMTLITSSRIDESARTLAVPDADGEK